jgi:hypothetical protein
MINKTPVLSTKKVIEYQSNQSVKQLKLAKLKDRTYSNNSADKENNYFART